MESGKNALSNDEAECCPLFDVERWNEKEHHWEQKKFIRASVPTLFHVPFPPMIGKAVSGLCALADEAGVSYDIKEVLLLFHDPSAFKSELLLAVRGEVAGADNVNLSGTYFSKVFDGPYNAIPKFLKEMDKYLAGINKHAVDYYVHYAYCPKCMKKYGHNYMAIFAKV